MTATHEQHDRQYPRREEMQALVDGLGPSTLFDLFEEYEVPEDDRFRLIEEVLGLLVVHGRPVEDLTFWFLSTLEEVCSCYASRKHCEELRVVARIEYLCRASQDAIFRDPRLACTFAERAVALSDRVRTECSEMVRADQQVLARAWLGNARRVASNMNEAERSFQEADEILRKRSSSVLAKAHFWSLLGSHRLDQGRYAEATQILTKAHQIYERSGSKADQQTVKIKLANAEALDGRPARAVNIMLCIVDDIEGVEGFEQPRTRLALHHALMTWMVEAGQIGLATERFARMQYLYDQCEHESRFQMRRKWLEAKIFAAKDDLEAARETFASVRAMARDLENHYECASVSLELALVHLRLGDLQRVEELAEEMVSFFRSQSIHHFLLAAMQVLASAARSKSLTIQLMQEIQRYLELEWHDPLRRFEPTGH